MSEVALLIADMVRAGIDPDIIGRTASALAEREPTRIIDGQAERRRAADRERKRLRNSADSADAPHPPALDKEIPPAPPKEINPTPLTPQTTQLGGREAGDLDRLSERLCDAADGKMQPQSAIVVGPVLELIANGVDLETDIFPTIRAVATRLRKPVALGYFIPAIREAFEARTAAGKGLVAGGRPTSQPAGSMMLVGNEWKPTTDARWGSRLNSARAQGQWSTIDWGPAPGQPGCIAPQHLLQPGDGEGWREWQSEAA